MRVRFVWDPAFAGNMEKDPQSKAARHRFALAAATATRAVGREIRRTGAYSRSIRVEEDRVFSVDPGAAFIEYGSRNNPPFAPLRKGAASTGAEFVDERSRGAGLG